MVFFIECFFVFGKSNNFKNVVKNELINCYEKDKIAKYILVYPSISKYIHIGNIGKLNL